MYRREYSCWSSDPTNFSKQKDFEPEHLDSGFLSGALDSSDNASKDDHDVRHSGSSEPARSFSSPSSFTLFEKVEEDRGDSGWIDVSVHDVCCAGATELTEGASFQPDELIEEAFGVDENGDTALHEAIMSVSLKKFHPFLGTLFSFITYA